MKVRALREALNEYAERYHDFDDWDVYTEQPELSVPEDNDTLEEARQHLEEEAKVYGHPFNEEYWQHLVESDKRIKMLKKQGWHFLTDSEGWVYRECAGLSYRGKEIANCVIFEDEKAITINNNY